MGDKILGNITDWAGWTPRHGAASRGEDKVIVIVDFVGGVRNKPTEDIGKYVGEDGYVTNINEAVALPKGADGKDFEYSDFTPEQLAALKGTTGNKGWTADHREEEYVHAVDDIRIIKKLFGYINGEGTPPTANVGQYLKSDGTYTATKADAMNYKSENSVVAANSLSGNDTGSSRSAKSLAPVGLTLTNDKAYNAIQSGSGSSKMVAANNVALFQVSESTSTGAIKIAIPTNGFEFTMISGKIYSSDGGSTKNRSCDFTIVCCTAQMEVGYNATFIGSDVPEHTVLFGDDGTRANPFILIGQMTDDWSYLKVSIDKVLVSHNGATIELATTGYTISLVTSYTGTVRVAKSNTLPKSNLSQFLKGYNFASGVNEAITADMSILQAFQNLQKQISSIASTTILSGTASATSTDVITNKYKDIIVTGASVGQSVLPSKPILKYSNWLMYITGEVVSTNTVRIYFSYQDFYQSAPGDVLANASTNASTLSLPLNINFKVI